MDSKSLGQRAPFTRTQTGDVQPIESKKHSISHEKELQLPAYSSGESDIERRASVASHNISGVHDDTHRKLKPRHIQLIGIGGTIGTALYVQIGRGLLNGGPGSLFIAFSFW